MISTITAIGTIILLITILFFLFRSTYFLKNKDYEAHDKNDNIITVLQYIIILFVFSTSGFEALKESGFTDDLITFIIYILIIILITSLLIINIKVKILNKTKPSKSIKINILLLMLLLLSLVIIFSFRTLM